MENRKSVDQKTKARLAQIRAFVLAHREIFLRQGTVTTSWRTYQGHRRGPFYFLRYRTQGKQSAIYLGRSLALAQQVKDLLRALRQDLQERRRLARWKQHARRALREEKRQWQRGLMAMGLNIKRRTSLGNQCVRRTVSGREPEPGLVH